MIITLAFGESVSFLPRSYHTFPIFSTSTNIELTYLFLSIEVLANYSEQMASKRKAPASLKIARASKKTKSGASTPQRIVSSDEYSDGGEEASATEAESLKKALDKFSSISVNQRREEKKDDESKPYTDFSYLSLKPDHQDRPLWLDVKKARITMEIFSALSSQAKDFLTTVAEPLSRPRGMCEYALTVHSLYSAVSVGLQPQDIIDELDLLVKTQVPMEIRSFILECTRSFGKINLVLRSNRYFLETSENNILQKLLKDEIISAERLLNDTRPALVKEQPEQSQARTGDLDQALLVLEGDMVATLRQIDKDEEDNDDDGLHSIEVPGPSVQTVKKRCLDLGYPVMEEYDFLNDPDNPKLDIDLRPNIKIRDYQEKSLSKMFSNGRARSGIIVLPCGAGKTLVGITAACTIKKGVIVLCTSSMSVVQWKNEFKKWSNIDPNDIAVFTSDHKEKFTRSTGIIVSTYSMVSQTRSRSYDSQKMMDFLTSREWGLMILDEVHVVPASIFRKVTHSIATHTKLGLTATLLREDDKISDLNFLIGPKLYEADWQELADKGHIAKVECAEVWCRMSYEFYQEYLRVSSRKRALLYAMNPIKFQACQYLIHHHEKNGDKIIVFSDNVFALERYALKLKKPYIYGGTSQQERLQILENFQRNDAVNTIFLSKVGDTSLDLPEATCLIQISSHFGSRRQEAQRLGRILRAKKRNDEGFNAYFYSLVSEDTQEMYYSAKRQSFLTDQGYAFKTITNLHGIEKCPELAYTTAAERRELLQEVMLQNETSGDVEKIDDDMFSRRSDGPKAKGAMVDKKGAKRTAGLLSDLSGGQDMVSIVCLLSSIS